MKSQQEIQKRLEEIGAKIDNIYSEVEYGNISKKDSSDILHILQVREDALEWVLEDEKDSAE